MRIFFDTILVFSALVLPLSVTILLVFAGFFLYPRYFEAVAVAALIELLYRGGGRDMWGEYLPLAALTFIILVAVEVLRSFIRERTP